MKTKKILAIHSKRRAIQRYGVKINQAARRELIIQIQTNVAKFVRGHTNRVKEFVVNHEGKELRCLYDNKRNTILTFLPPLDSTEAKVYEAKQLQDEVQ